MKGIDELTNSDKFATFSNGFELRSRTRAVFTAAVLYTTLSVEARWPVLFLEMIFIMPTKPFSSISVVLFD
jgi:hypothetical protein